jgi:uncharacterized alkaline shock family protein YloU
MSEWFVKEINARKGTTVGEKVDALCEVINILMLNLIKMGTLCDTSIEQIQEQIKNTTNQINQLELKLLQININVQSVNSQQNNQKKEIISQNTSVTEQKPIPKKTSSADVHHALMEEITKLFQIRNQSESEES